MKNNWMKNLILVALLLVNVSAFAQEAGILIDDPVLVSSDAGCVIPQVDGDKVPFPIRKANTKFDLSEGETYLLNGFLIAADGKHFFKPDFASQPWLATAERIVHPYFAIDPSNNEMARKYEDGGMVQVAVVARRVNESGMMLRLILAPVKFRR